MRAVRRAFAAPLRWAALGLLHDAGVLNRAAEALLIAWAWVRGPEAP